ncbi:phosphatidate cytidylyltransferase [Actinoplanes sp. NPDC051470]|uniref:phosphatidate cytidylyltransferase n=1 Tax=unclassified Actinoplanes TaxID=2626549 RepID=UPI0034435111
MSYLDPRGGPPHPGSGDRSSPAGDPDPYAAYWAPAAEEPPPAAPWVAPTAATSTSEAEYELTAGPRGKGKRRAGSSTSGRAGRNLPAALAVGTGLGLTVLASLVIWRPAFLAVIAAAATVAIWEMVRALRVTGAEPPMVPLIGGGLLMTGLAWFAGEDAVVLGLVVTVLAAIVWRLADRPRQFRIDFRASLLIAVYVPFLISFGVLMALPEKDGHWRVLCTLIAVILSDTGGYAAGVFLGKHPMAPAISPKKSWEGFGGSVFASAIGSGLLLYFLLDAKVWWGLLFGATIAVVAVIGDLAESMLKRDLGIKDMSQLLPGHGGLMDRLDSILFAVPTAYLLLTLIAPPG